jgi:hypothetical protein
MRQVVGRFIPWLAMAMLGLSAAGGVQAQTEGEPRDGQINQIKLTDAQVKNFTSAQPDLAGVAGKLQEAGDEIDPALQTELDELAKKHGFADFNELDDVAANISLVMAGLDAKSGEFTEPQEALKKELEDIKADASIPEADKKLLVDELGDAIENTPKLAHPENVEIVKAHREEIEKALQ